MRRGNAPRKPTVIDFHAHFMTPEVFEATYKLSVIGRLRAQADGNAVRPFPQAQIARMTDLDLRLAAMDEMGVDVQVSSPRRCDKRSRAPMRHVFWASIFRTAPQSRRGPIGASAETQAPRGKYFTIGAGCNERNLGWPRDRDHRTGWLLPTAAAGRPWRARATANRPSPVG
jgi:hypothetical protein